MLYSVHDKCTEHTEGHKVNQASYALCGAGGYYAPATYSSSSRTLLSTPTTSTTPALGVHRALSNMPLFSRLVTPSAVPLVASNCNLIGQQAEPACMQQGMCGGCFKSKIGLLGLSAVLNTVSAPGTQTCHEPTTSSPPPQPLCLHSPTYPSARHPLHAVPYPSPAHLPVPSSVP